MSKKLTEQWKKGKLVGRYFVKYRSGRISDWYFLEGIPIEINPMIVEVLAPVPSFEECLELESDSLAKKQAEEIIAELEAENEKLKMKNAKICDTLKKVRDVIQFSSPEEINLEIKCKIIKIIDILVRC